jgi:hypothetical protein
LHWLSNTALYASERPYITAITCFFAIGGGLGGVTAALLIPLVGWQAIFILGGAFADYPGDFYVGLPAGVGTMDVEMRKGRSGNSFNLAKSVFRSSRP